MADGTISVDLQLIVADAIKEAKAAAAAMAKEFSLATSKATQPAADAARATTAHEKETTAIKKKTKAIDEQLAAWRKLNAGGVQPGGVRFNTPSNEQPSPSLPGHGNTPWVNPIGGAASLATNAIKELTKVPKLTYPPNVTPSPKFKQEPAGKGILDHVESIRKMVLPIGQVLASFYVIKRAIDFLLIPLRAFAANIAKAAEAAAKIYASSIQSGFGVNMTVQRGMLARIIGVSEDDIYQFGAQIAYLNSKLEWSRKIITQTAAPLTQLSWEFKVLQENFKAMFSELADYAAPAILAVTEDISEMIKEMSDTGALKSFLDMLLPAVGIMTIAVGGVVAAIGGLVVGIQLLWDTLQTFIAGIYDSALKVASSEPFKKLAQASAELGALSAGSNATEANKIGQDAYNKQGEIYQKNKLDLKSLMQPSINSATALNTVINGIGKVADDMLSGGKAHGKNEKMPEPMAYMKQMPASAWERMGLAIGGGGSVNYGAITAANTKRTVTVLEKILGATGANKFNITKPAAIPAGA